MSWLDRISPQFNVFWHGQTPPGWIEPARRLYDHELVLVTKGTCRVTIEGKLINCPPGFFVIIPPDTLHVSITLSREKLYRYCLHFDWVYRSPGPLHGHCVFHPGSIKRGLVHRPPAFVPGKLFHGRIEQMGEVTGLLTRLCHRWDSGEAADRVSCRALLLEILLLLLGPRKGKKSPDERSARLARAAKELLDGAVSPDASIQSLLETLGYSHGHICRIFKKAYGTRPMHYLNVVRIERAKALLQDPRYNVGQVARLVGFNDPAYFARIFRRQTGVAPRDF